MVATVEGEGLYRRLEIHFGARGEMRWWTEWILDQHGPRKAQRIVEELREKAVGARSPAALCVFLARMHTLSWMPDGVWDELARTLDPVRSGRCEIAFGEGEMVWYESGEERCKRRYQEGVLALHRWINRLDGAACPASPVRVAAQDRATPLSRRELPAATRASA